MASQVVIKQNSGVFATEAAQKAASATWKEYLSWKLPSGGQGIAALLMALSVGTLLPNPCKISCQRANPLSHPLKTTIRDRTLSQLETNQNNKSIDKNLEHTTMDS